MENTHCVRTVHAEANAIAQAAAHGVRIEGASMYVTASPCWNCFKLLANAGIKRVVFREFYRDDRIIAFAKEVGIELVLFDAEEASFVSGGLMKTTKVPVGKLVGGEVIILDSRIYKVVSVHEQPFNEVYLILSSPGQESFVTLPDEFDVERIS
jgi:hypothetical protein